MGQIEIKFRCWYGGKMHEHVEALRLMYNEATGAPVLTNAVIMPVTGMKDKKGNDIYHKDYLRSGKKIFVVEWQKEGARFILLPTIGNPDSWKFMDECDHMEVCGNVYQKNNLPV